MTELVDERWVEVNAARGAWAGAAVDVLTEVAGHYGGVITYTDLAEQVQSRTRQRTRSQSRNWIGSVLGVVVTRCQAAGLPPLTSLVAHRVDAQPEEQIAQARLACYLQLADDVPAEVAARVAAEALAQEEADRAARERRTTTRTRAPRAARERKQPEPEEPPKVCPTCFMQLPASGICDSCD